MTFSMGPAEGESLNGGRSARRAEKMRANAIFIVRKKSVRK